MERRKESESQKGGSEGEYFWTHLIRLKKALFGGSSAHRGTWWALSDHHGLLHSVETHLNISH